MNFQYLTTVVVSMCGSQECGELKKLDLLFQSPSLIRRPLFGAGNDTLPEEATHKAHIEKSMANAESYEMGIAGHEKSVSLLKAEKDVACNLEQRLAGQKANKKNFWFRRIFNAFALGGMLIGSAAASSAISQQTLLNDEGVVIRRGDYKAPVVVIGVVGSIALLYFNCCPEWSKREDFKDIENIATDLKSQLDRLKRLEKLLIHVEETPDDYLSKRIDTLLTGKISWAAGKLSGRMLKIYDAENSSAKPYFDRIFGGREKMPTEQEIEKLFTYYAIQALKADQRLEGPYDSPLAETPLKVTREALLTKTYALLKSAMKTGDIYNFVMTDEDHPLYRQTYNMEMAGMIYSVEAQVSREFGGIRELAARETEVRQYIHKATTRLMPLRLAQEPGEENKNPDVQELEDLIKRLGEKQKRILALVGEESPDAMIPEEDLATLRAEVLGTLQETKAFLAELDQLIPHEQHPGEATALTALKKQAEAELKRVQNRTS